MTRARPTATPRKARAPRMVQTHVLINAGQTNHAGVVICNECGNLADHRIHDLNVASEAMEVDRRQMGEAE